MEKENSVTQFEGGEAPRPPVIKQVIFKSKGMDPVTAKTIFNKTAYVLTRGSMNVMCGKCGDVGNTAIVQATMPCWKNYLCNPVPCIAPCLGSKMIALN